MAKGKRFPRRASTAWAELRERMRRRPRLRLDEGDAELAIEIWREYKREGARPVKGLPQTTDASRATVEGDPIALQVVRLVEGTPGFSYWLRGHFPQAWFLAEIEEQLPCLFLGPWEGLCERDIELLEEADDAERRRIEAEEEARADRRLLGGFHHED